MAEGDDVYLYVYDLSGGMAARLSPVLIGKQVEGIWHTGVVTFGKEYYFGSGGINVIVPGTLLHEPLKKILLGKTFIPEQVFDEYLNGLAESEFRGDQYDLLKHNCNNFSDTLSRFLVGNGIPDYILKLPEEILSTPFGQRFQGLIEQISQNSPNLQPVQRRAASPEFYQLNSDIEAARHYSSLLKEKRNALCEKLAKREKKKNKKRRKEIGSESKTSEERRMSAEDGQPEVAAIDEQLEQDANARLSAFDEEERKEREERRRNREPPIVFKDAVDVHIAFDTLVGLIDGKLHEEEQLSLEELHKYMLEDEGSWALGESFLVFIGRLLMDKELHEDVTVHTLHVLAAAALKDDVILMLHQDRKHHVLMNYAFDVDRHPIPHQRALTLFICNLFENIASSEWLMYISEWTYNNQQLSNIRVTTKVAVNAILSDDVEMQDRGSAIIHNLATKEVFDDVAVELTMAVLQFLSADGRGEALVFRCLKSLAQFCTASGQDVPQLIQMIGPHPSKFKGQSQRIDELIQQISNRLR
ncbi:uncharacterized protein [Halyomorpha halys]|uniref:uncharacterized protein isoform X3 n=1 Tax=Halyomorpha halys TaxID=286706 RepID=UPI0006D51847|nr:uncharacterized protein LOC106678407 isoform X3 [Halyomorpha halys]